MPITTDRRHGATSYRCTECGNADPNLFTFDGGDVVCGGTVEVYGETEIVGTYLCGERADVSDVPADEDCR